MVPPKKSLEGHHFTGLSVDLRLVMEIELPFLDPSVQLVQRRRPRRCPRPQQR